jgi:prepilin-type N-terminal cleavage/methylation domain-containing protein
MNSGMMSTVTKAQCAMSAVGRAFSLIEMLVALTIVAALASVVAPMFSDDSRLRVMAASSIIASDIELAQVMTIAHPDAPVVVRFQPSLGKYWLAYSASPNTPIAREDTGASYVVTLGEGRARGASGVTLVVEQMSSDTITFAPHGGLNDFTTTPLIKVSMGTRGIQLAVAPNTGSIRETEFEAVPEPEVEKGG